MYRVAMGERARPWSGDDPHAEILRRRGDAHEREQRDRLIAEAGGDWVDLGGTAPWDDPVEAARRTAEAIRRGPRLIFQGSFLDGRWQGRADFLRRIDAPLAPGPVYEVLDTKLARHVKPGHVHQLALYSRLLGSVQGAEPDHAHVILGDGRAEPVQLGRYRALHRHLCRRLERTLDGPLLELYPEPTEHCPLCRFARECATRRRRDDHLSLVAGARRDQRRKLLDARIHRLAQLAEAPEGLPVRRLAPERFATLRHQARLQRNARDGAEPVRRHLTPEFDRGYARLPEPSAGDVYFDLEGDPYVTPDGGIEYLWGWSTAEGYAHLWAHDEVQERAALEAFVAAVQRRRGVHPDLHVFHYAPHEASTLRRLALRYATCEAVIDDWLRRGVLVDLYAVVRQALQVGEESYSLKRLERHHGFVRHETTVREGGGSIVAYEGWLATGDEKLLDAIREYNREDCESTASLHRWLGEAMRPEAEAELGVDFSALAPDAATPQQPPKWLPEVEALVDRLHSGLPDDPEADDATEAERRLLGHLLLYHHRESKPEWWSFFALREMSPEELVEEPEAVGLLELDARVPPVPVTRHSLGWTYRFPAQETKLSPGSVVDPASGRALSLVSISDGTLVLSRKKTEPPPTPRALIRGGPIDAGPLRRALLDVAGSVAAGDERFPAVEALLRRDPPRTDGVPLGPAPDRLVAAPLALDGSYLAVQGPPGTGKTHHGARMIVAAMRAGRRVALTAMSHHAVQNMLRAVEQAARRESWSFRGVYKGGTTPYVSPFGMVEEVGDNKLACSPEHALVAGTPWLLARDEHRQAYDLLVIDEAGQLSLASAVAAGRCARDLVLLGDPQQLPQVDQASHPGGSGASVLEHVLDGRDVIPVDRGVFLPVSWRMHPDVCAFVSERSYEGALRSRPECARRRIDAPGALTGAGLRVIAVEHEGRGQESEEEARAIAAACAELLSGGATVTDDAGQVRVLLPHDILVVAPYNLAVTRICERVPAGVRVGTVDRFQGQEAPVVFFAMTSSSGEDVPRGLDFVFDRNRLNVAISRAQCLAVLVHCPRLLAAEARTLEQMALIDGACRFVERAQAPSSP